MPGNFIDSNVLLYSATEVGNKAERAEDLLADGGIISVQVLNEVANVLRRKRTRTWPEVVDYLGTLRSALDVRPLTVEEHALGLAVAGRYQLATYDAMIVASALRAGCTILWSEDMHHGLVVERQLTIRNPFDE